MIDDAADHHALRHAVAAFPADRDVLLVTGEDAVSFLQGQLSADVAALAVGASTWSLLLEPQGKIDAWLRVTRRVDPGAGIQDVILDVDGGWGEQVVTRLNRFKLRVDASVQELPWSGVSLRGPGAPSADVGDCGAELTLEVDWRGLPGVDLLGPDVSLPAGIHESGPAAVQIVRVEQGWPAMGAELDGTVIPAEAGQWLIDRSVSFTKGCFTGQELVARIDSRGGNTPRNLLGLVLGGTEQPPPGATLELDGAEKGTLTSVARSHEVGGEIGLAYVHRSVEVGTDLVIRWDDGEALATVVDLPFPMA